MLKSSLCDYSDPFILVKRTIIITVSKAATTPADERSKQFI